LGPEEARDFDMTTSLACQIALAEMEKRGSGHVLQITTSLVDSAIAGVPSVLASLTKGGLD